jgi:hypothetical protein
MELHAGNITLNLSRDIPAQDQLWRRHLVVFDTGGGKCIGLVKEEVVVALRRGEIARGACLYHALSYAPPQIQVKTAENGVRIDVVVPPLLLPYDGLGTAQLEIAHYHAAMIVADQPDPRLRDYFYENYQNTFVPSRIERPGAPVGLIPRTR